MSALEIQILKQDGHNALGKEIIRNNIGEEGLQAVLFNSKGGYMQITRKFFIPYKRNFKLHVILTKRNKHKNYTIISLSAVSNKTLYGVKYHYDLILQMTKGYFISLLFHNG